MSDFANIRSMLYTRFVGRSIKVLSETTSTMDEARTAVEQGKPVGHVVVAETQTSGRGTHGRVWASPPGTDLYFSIALRPELPLASLGTLTLAVGLAISDAVDAVLGAGASRVKWVNDVLVGDKKIAGILVESRSTGDAIDLVVVGVGLNVNREAFEDELASRATSLFLEKGEKVARADVLADVLARVERAVDELERQGPLPVITALASRLAYVGEEVVAESVRGTVRGLTERGGLLLLTKDGDQEILAGHVERHLP